MEKQNLPEMFGALVFDEKVMRARLSSKVYASLKKTIDENVRLDDDVAKWRNTFYTLVSATDRCDS